MTKKELRKKLTEDCRYQFYIYLLGTYPNLSLTQSSPSMCTGGYLASVEAELVKINLERLINARALKEMV